MKRIIVLFLFLFVWSVPAAAQLTPTQMIAEINTNWPNNVTGAITPAVLRQTVIDLVNSVQFITSGGNVEILGNLTVDGSGGIVVSVDVSGTLNGLQINNLSALNTAVANIGIATSAANIYMQALSNSGTPFLDIRYSGGFLRFDKDSAVIMTLDAGVQIGTGPTGGDKGSGTLNVGGAYYQDGTIGVTCSGSPTSGFTSKLGIVTAC